MSNQMAMWIIGGILTVLVTVLGVLFRQVLSSMNEKVGGIKTGTDSTNKKVDVIHEKVIDIQVDMKGMPTFDQVKLLNTESSKAGIADHTLKYAHTIRNDG